MDPAKIRAKDEQRVILYPNELVIFFEKTDSKASVAKAGKVAIPANI